MKNFKHIIVAGSSGSGKTTIVNGVRNDDYIDKVVVPHRYVTRSKRSGDDLRENSHIDNKVFSQKVEAGSIDPSWTRKLEAGRIERYGFEAVEEKDKRLRVYSANNAFLRDKNPSVIKILKESLIVIAFTGPEYQYARLSARSPDMSDAERKIRLDDDAREFLEADGLIEIIDTTDLTSAQGQLEFKKIVDKILG